MDLALALDVRRSVPRVRNLGLTCPIPFECMYPTGHTLESSKSATFMPHMAAHLVSMIPDTNRSKREELDLSTRRSPALVTVLDRVRLNPNRA